MKRERIKQILKRFVFCVALTRHINLDTLSHEPFVLLPYAGREFLFDIEIAFQFRPLENVRLLTSQRALLVWLH